MAVNLAGGNQINRIGVGGGAYSFTIALTADINYYLVIQYQENGGGASLYLDWSFTGQTQIRIPYTNFVWPGYVAASPYTFTIGCKSGFTESDANNPNECYPICGDSLKLGVEVCDDGNTNNNDGCSSD
jgi:cysteine-rich repeat protein